MNKLHEIALALAEDSQSLTKKLANDEGSLPYLAADAGTLSREYDKLRADIISMHEKNQRMEI